MKSALLRTFGLMDYDPETVGLFEETIDELKIGEYCFEFGDIPDGCFKSIDQCLDAIRIDRRVQKRDFESHWINDERSFHVYLSVLVSSLVESLSTIHVTDPDSLSRVVYLTKDRWDFMNLPDSSWGHLVPSMTKRIPLVTSYFDESPDSDLSKLITATTFLIFLVRYWDESLYQKEERPMDRRHYLKQEKENYFHITRLLLSSFIKPDSIKEIPSLDPFRENKFDRINRSFTRVLKPDPFDDPIVSRADDEIRNLQVD